MRGFGSYSDFNCPTIGAGEIVLATERGGRNFPVICVGGSAGGLEAYTRLLRHLPADMGVAIVIVNHLRTVATQLHEILPSCPSN
jgi:chemotaxis response regulator CheB